MVKIHTINNIIGSITKKGKNCQNCLKFLNLAARIILTLLPKNPTKNIKNHQKIERSIFRILIKMAHI